MNRIADLIEQNLEELARAESDDQGKPLSVARNVDIPRAVENFRHFANALTYEQENAIIDPVSGVLNYTVRQPAGLVGIITPWNLPLYLLTFKLAPAIAHGNCVIAKPSEVTSVTAFMLCKLLVNAGLPPGVINMVFGLGSTVGSAIVQHVDVPLLSFTGSTVTGRRIAVDAAPMFKRLSLEMGGKNAALVFGDFDFKADLESILRSALFNSGQICLASSRILVEQSIYSEFVEKFVELARQYKIGDPRESETRISALVSKEHLDKVRSYIALAESNKHKLIKLDMNLSERNRNGFYCPVVIVTDVPLDSPLMSEEIFGPVICITPFKDEEDAIEIGNSSVYGLSSTVWTGSVDRMHRVAHRLNAGTVWGNCWLVRNLNMPFGGMKHSGIGRESTDDSRSFFTNKKTVCIKLKK